MIHIFTFLTDESRIEHLEKTSNMFNVNIKYIKNSSWNGYVDKIIAIKNAIKDIDDNDIICFIDAYDGKNSFECN